MIDIRALFAYLLKYKWLLLAVPLLSVVITYFLVKDLPKQYKSTAIIGIEPAVASQFLTEGQGNQNIGQQLYRIRDLMRMKRELDALSYRLIIHDLENPEKAFKPYTEPVAELSSVDRASVVAKCKENLMNRTLLTSKDTSRLNLYKIVRSMGYGDNVLDDGLTIEVFERLQYVNVSFESENPELSVYVVNTLSSEFLFNYNSANMSDNARSLAALDSILQEKKAVMNAKNAQLTNYSSNTGVSRGGFQSDVLYQQILANENRASDVRREVASLKGAIARIDAKLASPEDRDSFRQSVAGNQELLNLESQLQRANQQYVDNGFQPAHKRVVDSLQKLRSAIVLSSSGGTANNPQLSRQNMIAERMKLESQLVLAESSISSIENEIVSLRARVSAMMPADASAQNLVREADFATKEYTDALNRYNQASTFRTGGLQLNMIEPGLPREPETSKARIYVALSGISSFFLCTMLVSLLFLLDKRIFTADEIARLTNSKVIGSLNLITEKEKDLREIWSDTKNVRDYVLYKDLIRSLRFELSQELIGNGKSILGITSLHSGAGRTFIISSLAYAFALTGKKVLLIGEDTPDLLTLISNKKSHPAADFENFLVKKEIRAEDLITVLNKSSAGNSLLEMRDAQNLVMGFDILKKEFDVILIDVDCVQDFNRVKEWLMFTDRSIAVFQAGDSIRETNQVYIRYLNEQPGFMGWVLNKVKLS